MTADPAGPLSVPAPAKVNLYLHVMDQRDDGYHELDSLVVFAGINDVIEISPADDLRLSFDGPFGGDLPPGPENLALKAAARLGEAAGITLGAAIGLEKRLPVASGIGGGSADAAAVLNGLTAFWQVDPESVDLYGLALELGADVPVCLYGRSAFIGGVGEKIRRAPAMPPAWLVLANPGVTLSTQAVFDARQGGFTGDGRFEESPATATRLAEILAERENTLTEGAVRLQPSIADALGALEAAEDCLLARMSGSGATCFGLFEDAGSAARAAAVLSQSRPGWWVRAAPLLDDTQTLTA